MTKLIAFLALSSLIQTETMGQDATFSAALKNMRSNKFAQQTSHLNPALSRVASMAQQHYLDSMVMVFDESGSVTQKHFDTSKRFARDVIHSEMSAHGHLNLEIGIEKFGTYATSVLGLTTNAHQALGGVDRMTYGSAPSTNIADGLSLAGDMMRYSRGQKLVVLWTDGRHNTAGDPVQVARDLKSRGVCIIVIAIGPNVDKQQLAQIQGCYLPTEGPMGRPQPAASGGPAGLVASGSGSGSASNCPGDGLLIETDFEEIEANVAGFVSKVQGTLKAGAECPA